MKIALLLLVTLLSPILYFVLALGAGIEQPIPWVHYLLSLAAIAGIFVLLRREFRPWRLAALVVAVVFTGVFAWYMHIFSAYEDREHRVVDGTDLSAELAGWTAPSHTGEPATVLPSTVGAGIDLTAGPRATLLVFYRGFW